MPITFRCEALFSNIMRSLGFFMVFSAFSNNTVDFPASRTVAFRTATHFQDRILQLAPGEPLAPKTETDIAVSNGSSNKNGGLIHGHVFFYQRDLGFWSTFICGIWAPVWRTWRKQLFWAKICLGFNATHMDMKNQRWVQPARKLSFTLSPQGFKQHISRISNEHRTFANTENALNACKGPLDALST